MKRGDSLQMFFTAVGKKGDVVVVGNLSPLLFRGEKLIARDDFSGNGSRIFQIYVDNQPCLPWPDKYLNNWGIETCCFDVGQLSNLLSLPVCEREREIAIEIGFTRDGTWRGALLGRALR